MNIQPVLPRTYGDDCEGCSGPTAVDVLRFQRVVRAISGRWKMEIICALVEGPMRFGGLKRALPGITQHMLATQLKELVANGILTRRDHAGSLPRVDYALSQAGAELMPALHAMLAWSARYDRFLDADAVPEDASPTPGLGGAETGAGRARATT